MISVLASDEYLTEAEILERWPMLKRAELRRARRTNLIGFFAFRGGACSTAEQVQEYVNRTYLREASCRTEEATPTDSRSANTISNVPIQPEAAPGTPAGMTPELAQSTAEAFASEILSRPRSGSRSSSPRPRKHKTARLALIKS